MSTHNTLPSRHLNRAHRLGLLAAASTTIAALLLVGCTTDEDPAPTTPTPTATSVSDVPTATPFPTGTGAFASPTAASPTSDAGESGEPTADDAIAVLDRYFSSIGTRNYETAYNLWRNEGEASGQTYEEFVTGFHETASISWEIGDPGDIDAGAGQRFIEIPVRIVARTTAGKAQRFEGVYVLHHTADIDGATPEQRLWHIHSAQVNVVE